MAEANRTTLQAIPNPVLGIPLSLPKGCEHDISVILRVILSMAEEYDTGVLIDEGEPYEVLVRRLAGYHRNIEDIASRIKEVIGHE